MLFYGILFLPYFLVQDLSSLSIVPSPPICQLHFLMPVQSVLPICSQYCHLRLLIQSISPSPVHFIYFQGKMLLRNLQGLLITSGVKSIHQARLSRTPPIFHYPLQNAYSPANLCSSTSVSTILTNSFPPLFIWHAHLLFVSFPISQMKKLTSREVKGLWQCLWWKMNPSFSDSDSLLLSFFGLLAKIKGGLFIPKHFSVYLLRTRIFSYLSTVQRSNSGNFALM